MVFLYVHANLSRTPQRLQFLGQKIGPLIFLEQRGTTPLAGGPVDAIPDYFVIPNVHLNAVAGESQVVKIVGFIIKDGVVSGQGQRIGYQFRQWLHDFFGDSRIEVSPRLITDLDVHCLPFWQPHEHGYVKASVVACLAFGW